jgi:hypothetical protein
MSNLLELPFGASSRKVQGPSQSPGNGHEQSPTHADASLLLQAAYVAATTKSNKNSAATTILKCH